MRYAANLLFKYDVKEAPSPRPLCERRIINFDASGDREAIRRAKRRARQGEHSYRNAYDQTVTVKFVGLIDLISLEGCDEDEAYYNMQRMTTPERHVQPDAQLSVSAPPPTSIRSSSWAAPKALVRRKVGRARRRKA